MKTDIETVVYDGIELELTDAVVDVLKERVRQDEIWGPPDKELRDFLTILMKQMGHLAKEVLNSRFQSPYTEAHHTKLRTEAVQVAAVALALVESLDINDK